MFEIGWSELMLIGIVALIVIGPKELPSVLRTVGRTVTKLRRMASDFQGQFQEALREADIADMRKEISDVTDTARSSMGTLATAEMFDPLRSIREEIRSTVEGAGKPAPAPAVPDAVDPAVAPDIDPVAALEAQVPPPPAQPLPEPVFIPPAVPEPPAGGAAHEPAASGPGAGPKPGA